MSTSSATSRIHADQIAAFQADDFQPDSDAINQTICQLMDCKMGSADWDLYSDFVTEVANRDGAALTPELVRRILAPVACVPAVQRIM